MKIRIGTRGSPLALVQARDVRDKLKAAHGLGDDAMAFIGRQHGDLARRTHNEHGRGAGFTLKIEKTELTLNNDANALIQRRENT